MAIAEENQNENNQNKVVINLGNADVQPKDFDNAKEVSALDNFFQKEESENIKKDLSGNFSEGVRLPIEESNSQKVELPKTPKNSQKKESQEN